MDRVPYIDQSGLYALEEAVLTLRRRNVTVVLVSMQSQPNEMLRRIKVIPDLIPEDHVVDGMEPCMWCLGKELQSAT
jgi:SulP family sulfate permease